MILDELYSSKVCSLALSRKLYSIASLDDSGKKCRVAIKIKPIIKKKAMLFTIKERDSFGFNRYRLVLAADNPSIFKKHACDIFDTLEKDERVHMHVVHKDDIEL